MAVHVINEANRCLNCKKPMCMQGCPIHTPIPMMIKAFKEGNLNEAGEMLFENNAKIAGRYFDQKLGVLEEGAAADVIIVNYDPLTPMNENNINGHLVFGVTGHDVVTTVANGKVLMKDRRLTEIDEAKVMADCRQAAAELGKRINSR